MENKHYVLPKKNSVEPIDAFQNEISIKQSKQLTALFIANELDKNFDFDTTSNVFITQLFEKNCMEAFLKIILRNKQGGMIEQDIDVEEMSLNLLQEIVTDFFIINPGLIVLFGSSAVQAATTKLRTSLSSTVTGLSNPLPNSLESISEEVKNGNGGTASSKQSVN